VFFAKRKCFAELPFERQRSLASRILLLQVSPSHCKSLFETRDTTHLDNLVSLFRDLDVSIKLAVNAYSSAWINTLRFLSAVRRQRFAISDGFTVRHMLAYRLAKEIEEGRNTRANISTGPRRVVGIRSIGLDYYKSPQRFQYVLTRFSIGIWLEKQEANRATLTRLTFRKR